MEAQTPSPENLPIATTVRRVPSPEKLLIATTVCCVPSLENLSIATTACGAPSPENLSTATTVCCVPSPQKMPLAVTFDRAKVTAVSSKLQQQTYLSVDIPEECSKVTMILFECESRADQGFAEHKNRSHSWGDLVVKSSKKEDAKVLYRLSRAYENAVATVNYQMHVKHYSEDDEIVQECKPGSTLQLILNAQYRRWVNHAQYGRMAVYIEL